MKYLLKMIEEEFNRKKIRKLKDNLRITINIFDNQLIKVASKVFEIHEFDLHELMKLVYLSFSRQMRKLNNIKILTELQYFETKEKEINDFVRQINTRSRMSDCTILYNDIEAIQREVRERELTRMRNEVIFCLKQELKTIITLRKGFEITKDKNDQEYIWHIRESLESYFQKLHDLELYG